MFPRQSPQVFGKLESVEAAQESGEEPAELSVQREEERKEKFRKARGAHYGNEADAMARARKAMQEDKEEDAREKAAAAAAAAAAADGQ
jgi:hypothetical protein